MNKLCPGLRRAAALLSVTLACSSSAPTTQPTAESRPSSAARAADAAARDAPAVLPDVVFESLGGFTFDRAAFAGRPAVIVFVATTDPVSKTQLAELARAANRYGDNVKFFGVIANTVGTKLEIRDFLQDLEIPFPLGMQTDAIADAFMRPGTTPTTFVFDRDGKRLAHNVGLYDAPTLAALLKSQLE